MIMRTLILPVLLTAATIAAAEQPAMPVGRAELAARTEGAIAGGLRWLADRQFTNGAQAGGWSVNTANYRPAIASLAGMAFLSNGHLPGDEGPYGKTLAGALKYVMGTMASDGYVGQGDRSGMYIHAISALFALSCLGMQSDPSLEPKLTEWCRRSLDVIVAAQQIPKTVDARGGWRYDPYTAESDVSVTCWQLLVLHAARQAGFQVEPAVYNSALAYLNRAYMTAKGESAQSKEGLAGGFVYMPGIDQKPSRSSTALALFVQSLYDAGDPDRTQQALAYLRRYPLTWDGSQYNGFLFFSGFYMMQGMFQVGGAEWESFGPRMATMLLDHQSGDGSWPYPPGNNPPATMQGTGPAYPVAMSVLMLSLDKQYLPMYQRQRRLYENNPVVQTTEKVPEKTPSVVTPARPEAKPDVPVVPVLEPLPETRVEEPSTGGDAFEDASGEEEMPTRIGRPIGR
jgi:hypothetical protein